MKVDAPAQQSWLEQSLPRSVLAVETSVCAIGLLGVGWSHANPAPVTSCDEEGLSFDWTDLGHGSIPTPRGWEAPSKRERETTVLQVEIKEPAASTRGHGMRCQTHKGRRHPRFTALLSALQVERHFRSDALSSAPCLLTLFGCLRSSTIQCRKPCNPEDVQESRGQRQKKRDMSSFFSHVSQQPGGLWIMDTH